MATQSIQSRVIGVDLTDPYSKNRRDVDVAVLDMKLLDIAFTSLPWPQVAESTAPMAMAKKLRALANGDVLVVDGPQGLAMPGSGARSWESRFGAAARTPDVMPVPGRPFMGYVRGSLEVFEALVALGARLFDLSGTGVDAANLFEAYPGHEWPVLAGGAPLTAKARTLGRQQRAALIASCGVKLPAPWSVAKPPSHDQLDAALCALLGLWAIEGKANPSGTPVTTSGGALREGRILTAAGAAPGASAIPMPPSVPAIHGGGRPPKRVANTRTRAVRTLHEAIEPCDWVYRATAKGVDAARTVELALDEGIVVRRAHASTGRHQASVHAKDLSPGDTVLLVYTESEGVRPCARLRIQTPKTAVTLELPAFAVLDEEAPGVLLPHEYEPDPIFKKRTGFFVEVLETLPNMSLLKNRKGNNAIWPWDTWFA